MSQSRGQRKTHLVLSLRCVVDIELVCVRCQVITEISLSRNRAFLYETLWSSMSTTQLIVCFYTSWRLILISRIPHYQNIAEVTRSQIIGLAGRNSVCIGHLKQKSLSWRRWFSLFTYYKSHFMQLVKRPRGRPRTHYPVVQPGTRKRGCPLCVRAKEVCR